VPPPKVDKHQQVRWVYQASAILKYKVDDQEQIEEINALVQQQGGNIEPMQSNQEPSWNMIVGSLRREVEAYMNRIGVPSCFHWTNLPKHIDDRSAPRPEIVEPPSVEDMIADFEFGELLKKALQESKEALSEIRGSVESLQSVGGMVPQTTSTQQKFSNQVAPLQFGLSQATENNSIQPSINFKQGLDQQYLYTARPDHQNKSNKPATQNSFFENSQAVRDSAPKTIQELLQLTSSQFQQSDVSQNIVEHGHPAAPKPNQLPGSRGLFNQSAVLNEIHAAMRDTRKSDGPAGDLQPGKLHLKDTTVGVSSANLQSPTASNKRKNVNRSKDQIDDTQDTGLIPPRKNRKFSGDNALQNENIGIGYIEGEIQASLQQFSSMNLPQQTREGPPSQYQDKWGFESLSINQPNSMTSQSHGVTLTQGNPMSTSYLPVQNNQGSESISQVSSNADHNLAGHDHSRLPAFGFGMQLTSANPPLLPVNTGGNKDQQGGIEMAETTTGEGPKHGATGNQQNRFEGYGTILGTQDHQTAQDYVRNMMNGPKVPETEEIKELRKKYAAAQAALDAEFAKTMAAALANPGKLDTDMTESE
jgi:hypothetical protein